MKNISGSTKNWTKDAAQIAESKETKKVKETTKVKKDLPLDLSEEVESANKLLETLQKKYNEHHEKELHDAIIYLELSINNLN